MLGYSRLADAEFLTYLLNEIACGLFTIGEQFQESSSYWVSENV